MLTLIRNASVYDPEPRGVLDVLVAGSQIAAVGANLDISGKLLDVIDADGGILLPGIVDVLTHPSGGGGEGGFGNRTAAVPFDAFRDAGTTCPVGALGTDSIGRNLEVLFADVMALRDNGIDAHMLTGAYSVPPPTITGDVARDIALIAPVIGIGELAISDHRSSQPTAEELRRIAANARLGGTLSGKRGVVLVHVGDADSGLAPLRAALEDSALPVYSFYPTHVNRRRELLDEAVAFARDGGFIDITVSTTPELLELGEVAARDALKDAIEAGAPAERISLSSDAGGSLPVFHDGEFAGHESARPGVLLELLRDVLAQEPEFAPTVIAALTRNPANAMGLMRKGRIEAGADADMLILDTNQQAPSHVLCKGRRLRSH